MTSKEVTNRFNELKTDNKLNCTESELEEFISYGLLIKSNNIYKTRFNEDVTVDIIKVKTNNLTINLSSVIQLCLAESKSNNYKKIYCMTSRCYNKYKELGLIILKNNKEYYRYYSDDLWLVKIVK